MSSQNHGKSYQQISFNKQTAEEQPIDLSNYDSFNNQKTSDKTFQSLALQIKQLQMQLTKEKEKSSQLEKRNQQLTDMLVSASQSSVKRNQHFIKEVERKICNFKAAKDLSSSSFRATKEIDQRQPGMRIMTETGYESSKKCSVTDRESHSSRATKFDSNKENANCLNDKIKNETDKFSRSKYSSQDLNSSQFRPKERSTLSNFETQKSFNSNRNGKSNHFSGKTIEIVNKNSILSPFTRNSDAKIFNKLQHKLMRM